MKDDFFKEQLSVLFPTYVLEYLVLLNPFVLMTIPRQNSRNVRPFLRHQRANWKSKLSPTPAPQRKIS